MHDNNIQIEIDDKLVDAEQGATIIEVADTHNVYIPRFCYHKKLTVAANCRMCLVEVEGARKAMPACATPITAGMKIKTQSTLVRKAQKKIMEFLLINHPLDCPICDQGGQCELQDLSMGYGQDTSRYNEYKRVVKDKNLGPLISTDMTRCIHCTRCVRFGQEIARLSELGTMGRGQHTEITTYVNRNIKSEISGNMIDVCPVGALTSKPFRFTARAWELKQRPSIASHDCLGSNIYVHEMHNEVKRVVPRENESINEVWLSDRDRFSYVGLNSDERVTQPMLKKDKQWKTVDWTVALDIVASSFTNIKKAYGAQQLGALISPSSTLEEQYLLQKLFRVLGCDNIDHRLRQVDFRDQDNLPKAPVLAIKLADLEKADNVLLIGSNIQQRQPLAALRLLKARKNHANVMVLNPYDFNFRFPVTVNATLAPIVIVKTLAAIVKILAKDRSVSKVPQSLLADVSIDDIATKIANNLLTGERKAIILGELAENSPYATELRYFAKLIAELSGASYGCLSQGANTAGAWLTGCVPHRGVAGRQVMKMGLNAKTMFQQSLKGYFLFNVEPEFDFAYPKMAMNKLKQADFVVACSPLSE